MTFIPLLSQLPVDKRNPLHIYRHLLRETTYLPPVCRKFAYERIRSRFRRYQEIPVQLTRKRRGRIQNAYSGLRFLRAAVAGDRKRMLRVFLYTFGRNGKRRRELVVRLLRRLSPPKNLEALDNKIGEILSMPSGPRWSTRRRISSVVDKWDIPLLRALANSQHNRPNEDLGQIPHAEISRVVPPWDPDHVKKHTEVPRASRWGDPWSEAKCRRMYARWWKGISERILPPLEKPEWDMMRRLATEPGSIDEKEMLYMPNRRRRVATRGIKSGGRIDKESKVCSEWDWEKVARTPIDELERNRNRKMILLHGGDPLEDPSALEPRNPVSYGQHTRRTLRRMVMTVWKATPMLVYPDKENKPNKFDIVWGGSTPHAPPTRSEKVQEIFFGLPSEREITKKFVKRIQTS